MEDPGLLVVNTKNGGGGEFLPSQNGTSVSSDIFVWLTVETNTQTDHATPSVQ